MKNKIPHFLAFLSLITISYCTSSKKVSTTASSEPASSEPALTPAFTYEKDIAPFMKASCSPCHFPETGKVKQLDTYEATSKNIDVILTRVQLPVDHEGYMPLMSKKPALTEREIAILKRWQLDKMPK
ncbi:MAG: hypothetical protein ACKVQV_11225 [Bacteroidia bacterium]